MLTRCGYGPVSVYPSVTCQYCTKMAKCRSRNQRRTIVQGL